MLVQNQSVVPLGIITQRRLPAPVRLFLFSLDLIEQYVRKYIPPSSSILALIPFSRPGALLLTFPFYCSAFCLQCKVFERELQDQSVTFLESQTLKCCSKTKGYRLQKPITPKSVRPGVDIHHKSFSIPGRESKRPWAAA